MRLVHLSLQDGSEEEEDADLPGASLHVRLKTCRWRSAIAIAASPGVARLAAAQDDQEDDGGAVMRWRWCGNDGRRGGAE
jgi:hypothetical protein